MANFPDAIDLIKKYEAFNEKAYADPVTGGYPYTIGYGSQFYPDGSEVKQGQRCSRKKALEYLLHEIEVINDQLDALELPIDPSMRQALISFIHSVGWNGFLYSSIIDALEAGDYRYTIDQINQWIFDENHKIIGGLIERRREETKLFLQETKEFEEPSVSVLLKAFTAYCGTEIQIKAIRILEDQMSPYTLSEFINNYRLSDEEFWLDYPWPDADEEFNFRV